MSLKSSFIISFIAGTDSLYKEEQVVKFEDDNSSVESAGSLLQVYNATTGAVAPDWSTSTNQPCLKLGLSQASTGDNVGLTTSCSFQYQGNGIEFSASGEEMNGMMWYPSTDGMFAKAYNDDATYIYLRICENIASESITVNQQITYTLTYSDTSLGTGSVTGTTDIIIREGSSSSLYVNILTDNSELTSSVTSTELSLEYIYGDTVFTSLSTLNAAMNDAGITLEWYKDGATISYYGETLTVWREEDDDADTDDIEGNYVDGCNVFSVHVLDASGDTLATDSQRITDVADTYQVKITQSGSVKINTPVTVTGKLYEGDAEYSGSVTYTTALYNSIDEQTGEDETTTSTTGFSREVSASNCAFENTDGETCYGECTLVVTCEF